MTDLQSNLQNRKELILALQREIVGPDPQGPKTRITQEGLHLEAKEWRKPRRQEDGEEVVWQDPPTKRYGAGILYPAGTTAERELANDSIPREPEEPFVPSGDTDLPAPAFSADESEDYEIGLTNAYKPSALGLSFFINLASEKSGIVVELADIRRSGRSEIDLEAVLPAVYRTATLQIAKSGDANTTSSYDRSVWLRRPLRKEDGQPLGVNVTASELLSATGPLSKKFPTNLIDLEVVVRSRKWRAEAPGDFRLVTVSVVNRMALSGGKLEEKCLFQSGIRISCLSGASAIAPYPEQAIEIQQTGRPTSAYDDEGASAIQYSRFKTFSIGHGCAADWISGEPDSVSAVWSSTLPVYELPTTSSELSLKHSRGERQVTPVSMRKLAGLDPSDDGLAEVRSLLSLYSSWINDLDRTLSNRADLKGAARKLGEEIVANCRKCHARISDGLSFLSAETDVSLAARRAFRLANHAMLLSQFRQSIGIRTASVGSAGALSWSEPTPTFDVAEPHQFIGYWRPFQIAFLLMSIRGICEPEHSDRKIVDLIWFPTGGGKTEAYLGLTAFTIIFARLANVERSGVDVLMRYTLRLLTAQQFQRASTLFCALEVLRKAPENLSSLGDVPFRIGLWVGGSTTPNTRADALAKLRKLEGDVFAVNPFILRKCPWCGAMFGHPDADATSSDSSRRGRRPRRQTGHLIGYKRGALVPGHPTVVLQCGDVSCPFGFEPTRLRSPLPIMLVDEDLVDDPPNLLIGTVDKFAMAAWKPELRSLFGLGDDGWHSGEPPGLIIQDELHLISGPLGTMVGAYETLLEQLCRNHDYQRKVNGSSLPKVVASTATISRAHEQIKCLYARADISLFPPPGLDASDSFFASYATDELGKPKPGRLYVGVFAPSHGSLQTTEARVFATLLQKAEALDGGDQHIDPWWTLLCFFNSLRELGSAASLFVADARDYLRVIIDRQGMDYKRIRKLFAVEELTSRIRSDEIPQKLERLEIPFVKDKPAAGRQPVDACLASSIIEVGIDIQRLGVMCLVGQPKTTSQYIQVSSRVGRRSDCPGLVVTLYGPTKPRDRSHYERFRQYHQRLYAQVEPTSVTPFSPPAVDRALHALVVGAIRQFGEKSTLAESPDPYPFDVDKSLAATVKEMIRSRVLAVSPGEATYVDQLMDRRLKEWYAWQPREYGGFGAPEEDPPLIFQAGITPPASWRGRGWPTLTSMRDVDASCEAEVTLYFTDASESLIGSQPNEQSPPGTADSGTKG